MQSAPAPDVDRLIRGGRARRRRRNVVRFSIAAALVAVLVGGGVYGVMQIDRGTALEPAPPPSTTSPPSYRDNNGAAIEPGTYRVLVGVDAQGVAINADLTFDSASWKGGGYPVVYGMGRAAGVGVYRPTALAAGTGCVSDEPNREVGDTPQPLAQQLSQLPRSTVVQAPAPVQAFGHDAIHLRLRIDNDCDEFYRVAETVRGDHGITYNHIPEKVVIDFWVVDIDGVPVVVDMWHEDGASRYLVDLIARTRDSITFVTGG